MNICITTVYNSENCGSYWQAKILGEYLRNMGHQVVYLKRNTKGTSHSCKGIVVRFFDSIRGNSRHSLLTIIKQYCIYERYQKEFNTIPLISSDIDVSILGSDTIWNAKERYFRDNAKCYWGVDCKAKRTISYAASVGNTEKSLLEKIGAYEYIKNIDYISVRDKYTEELLQTMTDKKINIVCDPTLLVGKDFYKQYVNYYPGFKYILVYYFGKIPEQLQLLIRSHATKHQLSIVVLGNNMDGDEVFRAFSPTDFINYFYSADYVLTNTFHGTIFSINMEKQALFNSDGKKKIIDLLERFELTDKDYKFNNDENICDIQIDYTEIRKCIDSFRGESRNYIDKSLSFD